VFAAQVQAGGVGGIKKSNVSITVKGYSGGMLGIHGLLLPLVLRNIYDYAVPAMLNMLICEKFHYFYYL